MPWRSQGARDTRVVGCLVRRAANREQSQTKRKKRVAVSKAEQSWLRSEECVGIRHGDAKSEVCPDGFQSFPGPVFLHYAHFP